MEKNLTVNSSGKTELEIILSQDEFNRYYNKAVNDAKPHVQIAGFRKGKVPRNMIIQHYGGTIEQDAIENAGQKELEKIIETDNIKLVGAPAMLDYKKEGESHKFIIEFEVYPEFALNDYKGMVLNEPVHSVTDEEADAEIEKILESQSDLADAEIASDKGHVVGIDKTPIDSESKEINGDAEVKHIYLSNDHEEPSLVEMLIGTKVGDELEYEEKHDDSHDEHEGSHSHFFKLVVNDIKKVTPPALDDEFVKKYTQEQFDNVDDFKDDVQFKMQENWDKKTREELENQIVEQITDANDFAVPKEFTDRAADMLLKNFTQQFQHIPELANHPFDQVRDEFYPLALRTVKWELIRNKIIEDENIEVEEFDISPLAEKEAAQTDKTAEQIADMMRNNENFMMSILNKKVLDYILDFAETNEVDYDEFQSQKQSEFGDDDGDDEDEQTSMFTDEAPEEANETED